MQFQPFELVHDRRAGTGHEGGAHAISLRAQPQVEAGGLNLVRIERARRGQKAVRKQRGDIRIRQNPCLSLRHVPKLRDDLFRIFPLLTFPDARRAP